MPPLARQTLLRMARVASTVAVVVFALACGKPRDAVARVGSEHISQDQWRAYLKTHPATGADEKERLNDLVRREVAWLEAQKKGLLSGPAWEERLRDERGAILGGFYLAGQKELPPFTEAQAKEFYVAHNEEREVSHILLQSREEADLALIRLKRGEPFDDLARAVSKDPSAAKGGGDLGWIRKDQVVKEFGDAAFASKKGETIGPIRSQFGWHVIVVKEIRGPSDADFERDKRAVMARVETMRTQQGREAALEPLRKKYPLQSDMAVLDLDRTTAVQPGDEARIAGRVADRPITLKDLKGYLGSYIKSSGQSHSLGPSMKAQFMEMMADDLRLQAAALESGVDKRADVKAALWDAERESALEIFTQDFLATFRVPDADLEAFHKGHSGLFCGPGSLRLNVLVVDQAVAAQTAVLEASRGADWKGLYEKYADKAATGDWNLGWVEAASLQKLVPPDALKAMLAQPLGHVVGPVQGPEGYQVFQVVERREGPVLPLAACAGRVRAAYLEAEGSKILKAHLDGEGRKGLTIAAHPEKLEKTAS